MGAAVMSALQAAVRAPPRNSRLSIRKQIPCLRVTQRKCIVLPTGFGTVCRKTGQSARREQALYNAYQAEVCVLGSGLTACLPARW
jgi:hypothetical protein